ncbi:MAG: hypothetical protein COT36_01495 [Parcubacteria group bacterium CG08_land_8_20_14_0_20_38_56]|nr:MAG: hypothetical protein COT36_01495 [Parcubacteria group bacterium CG08_land_8_20_14_0_20_38_56]
MSFEQPQKIEEGDKEMEKLDIEIEKGTEKLGRFLELMSQQLREEGVPVDNECRINIDAFEETYSKGIVEKHKQELVRLEKIWFGDLSEEEFKKKKKRGIGEKMEMLKTAIFQKNLSPDFIVARSSQYDDIKNNVDNIILEKKTGNLVCALDEVADVFSSRFEEKRDKVLRRNMNRNGGTLRYGLKMEKENGKMKLKLGRIKNIPVFYLSLSPWLTEEGVRNFKEELGEQSDYEKIIFDDFINSFNEQIEFINSEFKNLSLKNRSLRVKVKERPLRFRESLERFSPQNK